MDRPDPNQTLHEVVAALKGDKDSLESLLARYHARLVAVAIAAGAYRTRDDVAQDALVKILLAIREGKVTVTSVEQFRAWAHSVARNTARDYLRHEGRQMRHIDSVLLGTERGQVAEHEQGREPSPSMEAHLHERMSELRQLHEARAELIAKLKWPDQVLVSMREGDGLTFLQIAVELGAMVGRAVTEDAIRIHYSRLAKEKIGPPVTEFPKSEP